MFKFFSIFAVVLALAATPQLSPLKNCPYPQQCFDTVLCKYHDSSQANIINATATRYHNANRVITYPDSHTPILVPQELVKEIKERYKGRVLELSPELK